MNPLLENSLQEELARWADNDLTAVFWWRDDDVQAPSAALDELLGISRRHQAPLSLAAVPDGLSIELPGILGEFSRVTVLQHGFSHKNHAPESERKMELGWHRPADTIRQQLRSGSLALQGLFGDSFCPVLVPPWNRIDPKVMALLPALGFDGISTLGPRTAVQPLPGLARDLSLWG